MCKGYKRDSNKYKQQKLFLKCLIFIHLKKTHIYPRTRDTTKVSIIY